MTYPVSSITSPVSSPGSADDVSENSVVVVELSVELETGAEVVELVVDWVEDAVVDEVVVFSVVELEEETDVEELEVGSVVVVEEAMVVELRVGVSVELEADWVEGLVGFEEDIEFVVGFDGRFVDVRVIELNRSATHWTKIWKGLLGRLLSFDSALNFSISINTAVSLIFPSAS